MQMDVYPPELIEIEWFIYNNYKSTLLTMFKYNIFLFSSPKKRKRLHHCSSLLLECNGVRKHDVSKIIDPSKRPNIGLVW